MKKNHLINSATGKCYCGISHNNQLIAFNHRNDWFDSNVNPIDVSNYQSILCINCMKQFDVDLIDKFEMDAFLIDYNNRLPNGKTAMRFFKRQSAIKRRSINHTKKSKTKPTIQLPYSTKTIEDWAANQSNKSAKGIARAAKKKANQLKVEGNQPAKIIAKPANPPKKKLPNQSKDDIIELKDEIKSIDKKINDKAIKTKEVIESITPDDDWSIGDPIKDKSIFELAIGNDWKLVRHNKRINQWKFVTKQSIKGKTKWIDDSEFIDYNEASELIIDGYCE